MHILLMSLLALSAVPGEEADYRVTALDLKTGETRWKTLFNHLPRPLITVHGNVVWADAQQGSAARRAFDVATGAPVENAKETGAAGLTQPVAWWKPVVLNEDKEPFLVGPAPSRQVTVAGVEKTLEAAVQDAQAAGRVTVFAWAPGSGMGPALFGVDDAEGLLAWELDLRKHVPDFHDGIPVSIAVSGTQGLAFVGTSVVAFNPANGAVTWVTKVPAAGPLTGEARGCRAATVEGLLLLGCRDGVAALQPDNGKLRWWLDAGSASWPVPTVADGELLGTRDVHDQPAVLPAKKPARPTWFVLLVKDASYLGGYRPEFARLAEAPGKERVLWSLAAPPSPSSRYVALIHEGQGADHKVVMVDVTHQLEKAGRALIRTAPAADKMTLMEGDRQVSSALK